MAKKTNGNSLQVKLPGPEGQASFIISKGGPRPNSGRRRSGMQIRKVSLALAPDTWDLIDHLKKTRIEDFQGSKGKKPTQSDLLQEIIHYAIVQGFFETTQNDDREDVTN